MPPRTVKRGASQRRTGRTTRGSQKAQNQPPPEDPGTEKEAPVKPEPESDPIVKQPASPPAVVYEIPAVVAAVKSEPKSDDNGFEKEDKIKESVDEYEKDERLELEDNDPEYETEEYVGVDYDVKEIDAEEDVQEVGDEEEEDDPEENLDEEDEGDEEELEDVREELEGEEYEEDAGKDHVLMERADADEADHHEVVKERRKRKEFEIFVGGLDKDATEGDLRKVFSSTGEVTEVRLLMNPQTKKNKGFAFLRFATVEQAKRAVSELKHPVINGKKCGVSPSQDSDTLFLGNICKSWTKEALKEKLKHYGVENVDDLTLIEDGNNQGMNRGFAFLEFSSRSEAMEAFKRLQKRDIVFGVDRPAKVSFADSFIDPGDEIMAQVKTVFVDALPATWDEDRVHGLLKKYGEVVKIELARNMPSAKRKDFGFVTFGTHDAAVTCAKSINNSELGEGDTKAKVRARLSRPLQKGKGKHSHRGDLRSSRASGRAGRGPRGHPSPRRVPARGVRGAGSRASRPSMKRPVGSRDRRPMLSVQARTRPLPPPSRPYDKRAPVSSYPKSSSKREYSRREEIPPPRSRPALDYGSRVVVERRASYKDEYVSRGPGFSDPPRSTSRTSSRRAYADDAYSQRYERLLPPPPPPPNYRDGRGRDYDTVSGSKRPYSSMDDIPPRYADSGVRQSRARMDYDYPGSASQYGDAYGDRLGRSSLGYSSSRSSQDLHGMYGSQGMGYGGGGLYSSSYGSGSGSGSGGSGYVSRGSDVGGSSYSSLYPGRGGGGGSYMGGSGSGSYY